MTTGKYERKAHDSLSGSFSVAIRGLFRVIVSERNMKIHLVMAGAAVLLGILFAINPSEWLAVIILTGIVLAAECINAATEQLVDMVSPEFNEMAGRVKDMAAGAVLVTAVAAVAGGLIIYLPYLLAWLRSAL